MKFGAPAWRARRTSATVIGIVALAAIAFAPCPARAEATEADSTTDVTCASATQAVPTTWYFPSTPPLGLVWLQHGFVEGKKVWSAFGPELAGSGYLVVATTLSTLNIFGCTVEHLIDNRGFLDNIAEVFAHKDDPRGALATSFATAAEKAGRPVAPLPDNMVFVGHSAGSEAVEYVAERLHSSYPAAFTQLRGVVSEDGVKSFLGSNTDDALAGLAGTTLPIYATASPHLLCNFFQRGTKAIERYFPDRTFHGVKITTGAHTQGSRNPATTGRVRRRGLGSDPGLDRRHDRGNDHTRFLPWRKLLHRSLDGRDHHHAAVTSLRTGRAVSDPSGRRVAGDHLDERP